MTTARLPGISRRPTPDRAALVPAGAAVPARPDHARAAGLQRPAARPRPGDARRRPAAAGARHVVARHEILRTSIGSTTAAPSRRSSPAARSSWPSSISRGDASRGATSTRCSPSSRAARSTSRSDVLLRAALVHLDDDEDLLLVVFHHIGSDHGLGQILFAELDERYCALRDGRPPELPELPIQYADFAAWQRERVDGDAARRSWLATGQEQLAGAPDRLELPDRPAATRDQSYRGRDATSSRSSRSSPTPLRALARSERRRSSWCCVAAFNTLLHRYTGAEDIVVGAPISGRHHEETSRCIGYFSNTLALRTDLSGDPTFAELLERVQVTSLSGAGLPGAPVREARRGAQPGADARATRRSSRCCSATTSRRAASRRSPAASLERAPGAGLAWSRFDFSLDHARAPDGSPRAVVEYATDLFDQATDRAAGRPSRDAARRRPPRIPRRRSRNCPC